ncbi:MAG: SatD family protein [Bacillota bacterium]|nr:SatD family protein [Bacillota bacterium]
MKEYYLAIIGDIVNSREASDRYEVQRTLKNVLAEVNAEFGADIAARFAITLGDEFQGLLKVGSRLPELLRRMRDALAPVSLRFGIGYGTITTELDPDAVATADGPAFYRARERIEAVKNRERRYMTAPTDTMFSVGTDGTESSAPAPASASADEALVNALFSTCFALRAKWTARQTEIIAAFRRNQNHQYRTAAELGIRQSGVYKALKNADYYVYEAAQEALSRYFGQLYFGQVMEVQDV